METLSKKKVLWVEDDKLLGKILGEAIAKEGFELRLALTGPEAVNILETFVPDVIMVDLYLPGDMNGYDILARVAKDDRLKDIPTVILSNYGRGERFGNSTPMEATKYLLKADVSIGQITSVLEELTKKK